MTTTTHSVEFNDAVSGLGSLPDESVNLVITSPPYPMIEMWNDIFTQQNPEIGTALDNNDGTTAFRLMHAQLSHVWQECFRVLKPGGFLCVNIGDATRKIGEDFQLFPSHSRILESCLKIGFQNLPNILWRKQTNAPNKFMGSGMLPPGAYVTLEHEYILIFRKGGKREFTGDEENQLRKESAYFAEERNRWFSDVWFDLKGIRQDLSDKSLRDRSGAYPFDLAYRLINMFSIKHDTVLDPFLGTGTTTIAAMTAERSSIGFEIDESFGDSISERIKKIVPFGNAVVHDRLRQHLEFVKYRQEDGYRFLRRNKHYGFPCISGQEMDLLLKNLDTIDRTGTFEYTVLYNDFPQTEFCQPEENEISIPPKISPGETDDQVSIFE